MATMKIRHKVLATRGLEKPIKFTVLPRVDVTFNEKGIAEVSDKISEKLLKEQPESYELVVEEKKEEPKPEEKPRVPKKIPKKEGESKERTEFIKQITD